MPLLIRGTGAPSSTYEGLILPGNVVYYEDYAFGNDNIREFLGDIDIPWSGNAAPVISSVGSRMRNDTSVRFDGMNASVQSSGKNVHIGISVNYIPLGSVYSFEYEILFTAYEVRYAFILRRDSNGIWFYLDFPVEER